MSIFLFSTNTYAVLNQDAYDVSLATTNGTFIESESKIPFSAEDNEETVTTSNNETAQEAKSL